MRFESNGTAPGAFVTGTAEARKLVCTDGAELNVSATFRLVVLDVR
mgnify:CR=1 FL=1